MKHDLIDLLACSGPYPQKGEDGLPRCSLCGFRVDIAAHYTYSKDEIREALREAIEEVLNSHSKETA